MTFKYHFSSWYAAIFGYTEHALKTCDLILKFPKRPIINLSNSYFLTTPAQKKTTTFFKNNWEPRANKKCVKTYF